MKTNRVQWNQLEQVDPMKFLTAAAFLIGCAQPQLTVGLTAVADAQYAYDISAQMEADPPISDT